MPIEPEKAAHLPIETQHLSPHRNQNAYLISDAMINALCGKFLNNEKVVFSEIKTRDEFEKVLQLRLKVYAHSNAYLLQELNAGQDDFESRSVVYAAWVNDQPIATIRLTPYPFETLRHLDELSLAQFLGDDYKTDYLEWSRLLVDSDFHDHRVMPALLIYAGMKVLTSSTYTQYFGFTKPVVRRLFRKFNIQNEIKSFSIPSRDNNDYHLLKGSFLEDFWRLADNGFML